MKVKFHASFLKDVRAIHDKRMRARIRSAVVRVELAESVEQVSGIKRLRATGPYYRLRVGDYRIGLYTLGDVVVFARALHRREIYRYFP